jgi:hypothetical protein
MEFRKYSLMSEGARAHAWSEAVIARRHALAAGFADNNEDAALGDGNDLEEVASGFASGICSRWRSYTCSRTAAV